jgi:PAS domain S-box-containing protein
LPERYSRAILFVAAAVVVLTLIAMVAVPFYISRESSENRELVTDELNPLESALGDADDFLLDVGLTSPQGEAEGPFGSYAASRTDLLEALDEALSHSAALDAGDQAVVADAHALGNAYVNDIADPVNELTIAGDEEGAAAIQEGAAEPFLAADRAIDQAVVVTHAEIDSQLGDNEDLEEVNRVTSAALGSLGIVSAAIVVALALGSYRSRRREQDALELSEVERSRLHLVIDSISDGVAVFDRDGLPIRVNEAGVELWGLSEDEITNLRAAEVTHPNTLIDPSGRTMGIDDLPSSIAMREDRRVSEMLFTLRRASGEEIEILSSAAPLHDFEGNVNGAVVVWHDVTQLRSVEKLKDEFLSFAAHELRTPLTIVKGYASVMSRDDSDPERREMALAISEEADRIAFLINQLLDVSRIEAGSLSLEVQTVRLAEIVDQVVARHRDVDPEREITIDFDSPETTCVADPEALTQVLDNLIANARKYSEPGTPVSVRVESDGSLVHVSVVDQGIGIPPDEVSRLGEKLFRATNSRSHEGTGLGLFIASKYLELQNGRLDVQSELNAGSTFTIVLPCPDQAAPVRPAEGEAVEA